jgi:hypothetical protein
MADSSVSKAGQSAQDTDRLAPACGLSVLHQEASGQPAPGADRLALVRGPSAVHQEASDDTPTSMEEDDLLGEDLVDYEASPERPGMDVNVITFSTDCTIIGDNEPVCRRFDPGGSLDRRVNCRRVPQPRWVGARQSAKGGKAGGRQA